MILLMFVLSLLSNIVGIIGYSEMPNILNNIPPITINHIGKNIQLNCIDDYGKQIEYHGVVIKEDQRKQIWVLEIRDKFNIFITHKYTIGGDCWVEGG